MVTITSITDRTVTWTDEYGDEHDAHVEMVLARPDEYDAAVVDAVVAAQA